MPLKIIILSIFYSLNILAQTIQHKGYSYETLVSPHTQKVWLDRNIGAKRACQSLDDIKCFGDYFQWGRNADGHEKLNSVLRQSQIKSFSEKTDKLIIATEDNEYDWANKLDADGAMRQKYWTQTDGSNVCPKDFRVPTIEELQNETTKTNKVKNKVDAYKSFLKFPAAGFRHFRNGSLQEDATFIWSASVKETFSYYMVFADESAIALDNVRPLATSVRCIKN